MNFDSIWSNLLDKIKLDLTSLSYDTWFADTKLYKLEDGKAYIIVPMQIHKKHLADNYSNLIIKNLNELTDENYDLVLLLKEEIEQEEEKKKKKEVKDMEPTEVPHYDTVHNNLNKKYTFDSFVVGNSNKFAQAAALSVAENPGSMYNPLFLYGNSGLGKTHLMHAIGNFIV